MERPFGISMAPFHPAGQNPTFALERDLELLGVRRTRGWRGVDRRTPLRRPGDHRRT